MLRTANLLSNSMLLSLNDMKRKSTESIEAAKVLATGLSNGI